MIDWSWPWMNLQKKSIIKEPLKLYFVLKVHYDFNSHLKHFQYLRMKFNIYEQVVYHPTQVDTLTITGLDYKSRVARCCTC